MRLSQSSVNVPVRHTSGSDQEPFVQLARLIGTVGWVVRTRERIQHREPHPGKDRESPPGFGDSVTLHAVGRMDLFTALASDYRLFDKNSTSPDGLPARYLYSQDMVYRYAFWRWWGPPDPSTSDVWVLLNPATGDTELRRRPTLARCLARSRADDKTGVIVVNLFAHRDTSPRAHKASAEPIGPANDHVLEVLTRAGARTIAAWGSGGNLYDRSSQVATLLDPPLCLGTTRLGQPRHPLYVSHETRLVPWTAP